MWFASPNLLVMKNLKRWRIPPPPALELDAPDGAEVLAENPARLGMVFWDGVRDVLRWTECSWRERSDLRDPVGEVRRLAAIASTGADERVTRSLELVTRTLGDPARVDAELLSLGCTYLSSWAEQHGALATAAVWAHAAACVCPGNPQLAYKAGRLARRRADYARAEEWLTRAVLLGRQVGDWESYGRGFLGLGNVHIQRGDYPRAKKRLARCRRVSVHHGLRALEADALHDLCGIAIEAGHLEEVNVLANAARRAFGEGNPRLPILAHDVAYAWMQKGYFAQALEVFEAALPHYGQRHERVLVLADIARAAAGIGDTCRFDDAWARTWSLIEEDSTRDHVAQGLLDLARGAAFLRRWEEGERAARRSLELAWMRQEARVRLTAEAVLEQIQRERGSESRTQAPDLPEINEGVEMLTVDFVGSLRCAVAV